MTAPGSNVCRICGSDSAAPAMRVREMMLGMRDEFDYLECAACGSLQIAEPPRAVDRYYPPSYYSLAARNGSFSALRTKLGAIRARQIFGVRSLLGQLLVAWRGTPAELAALARVSISRSAAILDVGCGRGDLLRALAAAGFTRLHGIDPFIAEDLHYPDGVSVFKAAVESFGGRYDVVMLHHALEHVADPQLAMAAVARLLTPGGLAIVRVPLADSQARRTYGANWVQLDAPRHAFVPSRRGMCILAARAGLVVADVVYDSTAFQFWGSELYQQGVPLHESSNQGRVTKVPRRRVRLLERAARDLNAQELGDQACFYLTKTGLDA